MKNITVNGLTIKVEIQKDAKRNHLTNFASLELAVNYMCKNDITHKWFNIGNDFFIVNIEKAEKADENWGQTKWEFQKIKQSFQLICGSNKYKNKYFFENN